MAKTGTTHARLWQVLCEQNESDPRTFSTDKSYHIRRVLDGKYVFLGNIPERMVPTYVKADFSNIKFARLHNLRYCMAIPQKAFYKDDLERVLYTAIEVGIVKSIRLKWIPDKAELLASKVEMKTDVHLSQLDFLLYFVATGISIAILIIILEIFVHRYVY